MTVSDYKVNWRLLIAALKFSLSNGPTCLLQKIHVGKLRQEFVFGFGQVIEAASDWAVHALKVADEQLDMKPRAIEALGWNFIYAAYAEVETPASLRFFLIVSRFVLEGRNGFPLGMTGKSKSNGKSGSFATLRMTRVVGADGRAKAKQVLHFVQDDKVTELRKSTTVGPSLRSG